MLVLVLGTAEFLAAGAFIALMLQSTDPLGRVIGEGMTKLLALPLVLLVIPGLAMGLLNRQLPGGWRSYRPFLVTV